MNTCETCKWWRQLASEDWEGFGDCENPLFHMYKRDESERLGGRYDRMANIMDSSFGKDFGCIKHEPKESEAP